MAVFFALEAKSGFILPSTTSMTANAIRPTPKRTPITIPAIAPDSFKKTFFRDHVLFEIGVTFLNS